MIIMNDGKKVDSQYTKSHNNTTIQIIQKKRKKTESRTS